MPAFKTTVMADAPSIALVLDHSEFSAQVSQLIQIKGLEIKTYQLQQILEISRDTYKVVVIVERLDPQIISRLAHLQQVYIITAAYSWQDQPSLRQILNSSLGQHFAVSVLLDPVFSESKWSEAIWKQQSSILVRDIDLFPLLEKEIVAYLNAWILKPFFSSVTMWTGSGFSGKLLADTMAEIWAQRSSQIHQTRLVKSTQISWQDTIPSQVIETSLQQVVDILKEWNLKRDQEVKKIDKSIKIPPNKVVSTQSKQPLKTQVVIEPLNQRSQQAEKNTKKDKKIDKSIKIDETQLEKELQELFSNSRATTKQQRQVKKVVTTSKQLHKNKRRIKAFKLGMILGSLVMVVMLAGLVWLQSSRYLKDCLDNNCPAWQKQAAVGYSITAPRILPVLAWIDPNFVLQKNLELELWQIAQKYDAKIASSVETLTAFLSNQPQVSLDLETSQNFDATQLLQSLAQLQRQTTWQLLDPEWRKFAIDTQEQLQVWSLLEPSFNQLIGAGEPQTTVVALLDPTTATPLGGSLQAVLVLQHSISGILDWQVLPANQLRDGSASLEEQSSWQRSSWQQDWSRAVGQDVDQVVTLPYPRLVEFLSPISWHSETITEQNIHNRIDQAIRLGDNGVIDGQNTLDEILSTGIAQVLQGTHQLNWPQNLLKTFSNWQWWHSDPELLQVYQSLGWSSVTFTPSCPEPFAQNTCLNVGVIENIWQQPQAFGQSELALEASTQLQLLDQSIQLQRTISVTSDFSTSTKFGWLVPSQARRVRLSVDGQRIELSEQVLGANTSYQTDYLQLTPLSQMKLEFEVPASQLKAVTAYIDQFPRVVDTEKFSASITSNQVVSLVSPQAEINENSVHFSSSSYPMLIGIQF